MAVLLNSESEAFFETLLHDEKVQAHLSSLREHHGDTYEHSMRVGVLSVDLGYSEKLSDDDLRLLGRSGVLHDIGKTKIPVELLSKPAALNPQERKLISTHPRIGFLQLSDLDDRVRRIIVAHHEYKPNPYPRSEKERRQHSCFERSTTDRREVDQHINTLAQMVAAADLYDALTSKRAYKEPLPKEVVERIIREEYKGDEKWAERVLKR